MRWRLAIGSRGAETTETNEGFMPLNWKHSVLNSVRYVSSFCPGGFEMQNFLYDLRYGIRQLRNTPGMALLAILTLALGVGANTAIFTVIDSVLLRPLPYAQSERLMFIGPGGDKPSFGSTSWLNYKDVHDQSRLLQDAAGDNEDVSVLQTRDSSQSVVAPRVTTNLFTMLGAKPLLGRTFVEGEGLSGGPRVVILSEGIWREMFHATPGIAAP